MERRAIMVRGIVQGVGFRPFVYNLAARLQLQGFVRNQAGSVLIEVEGDHNSLDRFVAELTDRPPALAHIERIFWEERAPRGEQQFRIEPSQPDASSPILISPDVATCDPCLAELNDPADRRHDYPFINCTNCGPRLTIITGAPYDRPLTTMASFEMCAACRAEYKDPANRRFHAQPIACPDCGPRLCLLNAGGTRIEHHHPLAFFSGELLAGRIGALKGLGGYHLVCDARNGAAVAELRRRKQRDDKPFAVMVPDPEAAAKLCELSKAEQGLMTSSACPIVLLKRRIPCLVAEEVAPRNPWLGVMVPYTPLHHLLFRAVGGIPLVMTSGNRSDEPIAYRDDDAMTRLAGIADLFLVHDRPIHVRCDDSVARVVAGVPLMVRRSRGYAPRPIELPFDCPVPLLALGGQLKATFAIGRERQAVISHHLGDLDHYEAYLAYLKDIALYQELCEVRPEYLVCDLHPDYATTRLAQERADMEGKKVLSVQHHHAHMASCMAEHELSGSVISVTFDGTGYGTDGAIWGGEFLVGGYDQFYRAAHLRYVGMPGGDQAIREPWRMAIAHAADAGVEGSPLGARVLLTEVAPIRRMLDRGFNTPLTSSIGRLFDAVASLAGVRDRVSYEGQAAIELEWLATGIPPAGSYPFEVSDPDRGRRPAAPACIDTRPLIRAVVEEAARGVGPHLIARRFHATLVDIIASVCCQIRKSTGLASVVLTGGVFLNALLASEACMRLRGDGFQVYRHRLVPSSDGGLSLGQLAVAAASLATSRSPDGQ